MRLEVLATALAIGLALSASAAAPSRDDNRARCRDANPDISIAGCTALIQSGQETTNILAVAFYNRGISYDRKGEHDRAIQDYGQAISVETELRRSV